jgi:hypothetical protein
LVRRALLIATLLFTTICLTLVATGGFVTTILGIRVSARSALPTAVAATVAGLLWLVSGWRSNVVAKDLAGIEQWIDRRASMIVFSTATIAAATAIRFGTFSAGGSDASGYLSQAEMLSRGAITRVEPLAIIADWPDAAATLAPLGWRAAAGEVQVPTYAAGLPLLMTVPHALGGALAACLVVSIAAALVVWLSARIAMLFADGAAGLLAAVWIASMPIELYESIQPMSDVPVTAAWLATWLAVALVAGRRSPVAIHDREKARVADRDRRVWNVDRRQALLAGIAAAVAVLIRPNLAPLAAIPFTYVLVVSRGEDPAARLTKAVSFAAPVAFAAVLVAYLQWRYFGSALRSGYGSASEIYSLSNLAPNAALYFHWLVDTHGLWPLAAVFAVLAPADRVIRWMLAFAAFVCGSYLLYSQFEAWPYLRFLLPAMTIAAIATSIAFAKVISRLPVVARVPMLLLVVLSLATWQIARARELDVFRFAGRQSRALLAGRYLDAVIPPRGVVLVTGEQSGAMRYYTGQPIVRWDFLSPDALPRVVERVGDSGHELWIVLDDWETGEFRDKFRGVADAAGLDWPPLVEAGNEVRMLAWRTRDRAPFLAGARIVTDRVR